MSLVSADAQKHVTLPLGDLGKFPLEIRREIYGLVVAHQVIDVATAVSFGGDRTDDPADPQPPPSLLGVSKVVRIEAEDSVFRQSCFSYKFSFVHWFKLKAPNIEPPLSKILTRHCEISRFHLIMNLDVQIARMGYRGQPSGILNNCKSHYARRVYRETISYFRGSQIKRQSCKIAVLGDHSKSFRFNAATFLDTPFGTIIKAFTGFVDLHFKIECCVQVHQALGRAFSTRRRNAMSDCQRFIDTAASELGGSLGPTERPNQPEEWVFDDARYYDRDLSYHLGFHPYEYTVKEAERKAKQDAWAGIE